MTQTLQNNKIVFLPKKKIQNKTRTGPVAVKTTHVVHCYNQSPVKLFEALKYTDSGRTECRKVESCRLRSVEKVMARDRERIKEKWGRKKKGSRVWSYVTWNGRKKMLEWGEVGEGEREKERKRFESVKWCKVMIGESVFVQLLVSVTLFPCARVCVLERDGERFFIASRV